MFDAVIRPDHDLGALGRIGPLARSGDRLEARELAALFLAGSLAACAVGFVSLGVRIPGAAILRATLPMVCGLALVPRRMSGSLMSASALSTVAALATFGVGRWQPAAFVSLVALGPAIDLAMAGRSAGGWRLYVRFAAAGILANSIAFGVRAATSLLAVDGPGPHAIHQFGPGVFASFAACGALAGLSSAAVCFRTSPVTPSRDDQS